MPKRFSGAAPIIATIVLAACSGNSGATVGTDPPLDSDAATVPPTSTTSDEPAASEPAPTTSSTPSSTTTTEPSATTTVPSVEDEVTEASFRVYNLYWSCLRTPDQCDVGSGYLPGSDAFDALTNTVSDLAAAGLYVGEEDEGYHVIESIEIKDDHTAVTSCWWATGVLYLLPPIDGAEPTIQNDRRETARQVDEFVQDPEDGVWKIRRSDQIELVEGENTCPPEQ